ncbi:MAG: LamG-like jellyroll fold domain-containing protein, partial [Victivallales bacterium]
MKKYSSWNRLSLVAFIVCVSTGFASFAINTYGGTYDGGLVAYYPFDGNANDATGNGNNGTIIGATLSTDRLGRAGKAYYFDGVSNYITVPFSEDFNVAPTGAFTISVWVKPVSLISFHGIFVKGGDDWDYGLLIMPNQNFMTGLANYSELYSTSAYKENEWQMVTAVYNNGDWKMYLDGVLDKHKENGALIKQSSNDIAIGAKTVGPGCAYRGTIDELRIYNRELSAEEILLLYQNSSSATHAVTFVEGTNGTISGTKIQTVDDGADCTAVTAVPNPGYKFINWTGDFIGTTNPLTISNVTESKTITAIFATLIADSLTDSSQSNLNPKAKIFTPPAGDGRGNRNGIFISTKANWLEIGTSWTFKYKRNGTDWGLQVLHPYMTGQVIIHINRSAVGISTPTSWFTTGWTGWNESSLTKTADFDTIFPLVGDQEYNVITNLAANGDVSIIFDGKVIANGIVSSTSIIYFSNPTDEPFQGCSAWDTRQFAGTDFPYNGWPVGSAGLIIAPVDQGYTQLTSVYFSPGISNMLYVATTGSDVTGNGSQANPFATIKKAIDTSSDNDVITVATGAYKGAGNVNLDFKGKKILLQSADGAAT